MAVIQVTTVLFAVFHVSQGILLTGPDTHDTLCNIYKHIQHNHTSCVKLLGSAVTAAERNEILAFHNNIRSEVSPAATDMVKMTWDHNLADLAQRWVNRCQRGHDENFNRYLYGIFTVGQNWDGRSSPSWHNAMQAWANEKAHWTYANGGSGTGHYTQMIWAQSYKVGCAMAHCPSSSYHYQYVCNYGPGGNTHGHKPYTSGTTASACQKKDGHLCDCGGKICRNYSTLDTHTCTCGCKASWQVAPDCKIDCAHAVDSHSCGSGSFVASNCNVYSNMPVAMCPKLCKVCPAINGLH